MEWDEIRRRATDDNHDKNDDSNDDTVMHKSLVIHLDINTRSRILQSDTRTHSSLMLYMLYSSDIPRQWAGIGRDEDDDNDDVYSYRNAIRCHQQQRRDGTGTATFRFCCPDGI